MAGDEGSSEEFVDDDSSEEEEEEEEEESAFDSEEDQDDLDGGEESDIFETPQDTKKRPRVSQSSKSASTVSSTSTSTSASKSAEVNKKASAVPSSTRKSSSSKTLLKATPPSAKKGATPSKRGSLKGKGSAAAAAAAAAVAAAKIAAAEAAAAAATGTSAAAAATIAPKSTLENGFSVSRTEGVEADDASRLQGVEVESSPASRSPHAPQSSAAAGGGGGGSGSGSGSVAVSGPMAGGGDRAGAKTPKAAISDYMFQSNRPYSCINVFDNLHKKIPKAMVQKLLDELTKDGTVKMQEYGKSRIYYANQDALPNGAGDVSDAKLRRLEQEAKALTSDLEVASIQAREAYGRVQALSSQPTDAALEEKLVSTGRNMEENERRNASIKGQGHSVIAGGMKTAKSEFNKFRSLWVNRKRSAMDVVDMISDGMEKKPKVIMDMLGLEPDEISIPARM